MVLANLGENDTEGDVETKVVVPLLTKAELLGINPQHIRSKEFLAAFDIGKGTRARKGYIPDFSVYVAALPKVVVEAKAPSVDVTDAWYEAGLYAHIINGRFRTGLNPCEFILATNGAQVWAGRWDEERPSVVCRVDELVVGSTHLASLQSMMSQAQLEARARVNSTALRLNGFRRPCSQDAGPSLIAAKIEPNTFAADLTPTLRRYFSSRDQIIDPEIYTKAYVSSDEITSYDRILESFLTDRLSRSKSRKEIHTTKKRADEVSKRLSELAQSRLQGGELQLITGGVGSGKSLFARRYKEHLQSPHLRENSYWSYLDFNHAPFDLSNAQGWICESFVKSLIDEGAPIDLRDGEDQERIFADELNNRAAFYQRMESISPGRGELERARDIEQWRLDHDKLSRGLSRYIQGHRNEIIIAVFDNVDRRDVGNQLAAFQLALWFMDQMRCLVILQMRDTTFEAYKNQKPLDTYKTGQIFHISPPKFIDVVKRRLELSLAHLAEDAPETIKYRTKKGLSIIYPKSRAGEFLKTLYLELFHRPTNIARVLEALAGRNIRKALSMFMAVITSGHMPDDIITMVATGNRVEGFPEWLIIRILMRQDNLFYSENSEFIANIFYCDPSWERPSNFIVIEALFYLISNRKTPGDNGQLGFVCMNRLLAKLESFGFVRADARSAVSHLLERDLIEADSVTAVSLEDHDCVKATASGWAHMRILSSRSEYISSVLPTTAINDKHLEARVCDLMNIENKFGNLQASQSIGLVKGFSDYLHSQFAALKVHPGYTMVGQNGASYVLAKVGEALRFNRSQSPVAGRQLDWLDA